MSVELLSRKGDRYYLHEISGKSGKPRFHFSTDSNPPLAEAIPHGYEIYENIRGQVFLRKIPAKIITDEEFQTVRKALNRLGEEWWYKTEVKKNIITVYETDRREETGGPWLSPARLRELAIRFANYQAVLRFILLDRGDRKFKVERYCFRGSVDDWISVGDGGHGKLSALATKYVSHLGNDSFYELY